MSSAADDRTWDCARSMTGPSLGDSRGVLVAASFIWLLGACGKARDGTDGHANGDGLGGALGGGTGQEPGGTTSVGGTSGGRRSSGMATGGRWGAAGDAEPLYVKASNTDAGDLFGVSVALSGDGSTLAVGANREASASRGVGASDADNFLADSGAVYVFSRSEGAVEQQAYVKASNSGAGDGFGSSVAVSADGSTLAIGAPFEASAATGIDGDQVDDSFEGSGATYVFARRGDSWEQQAYIKASNADADDFFGTSVALSADGSTLAVGADGADGSSRGVDGDPSDAEASEAGAVYLLTRSGGVWEEQALLKASNAEAWDHFGASVALSADGNTLAVGAAWEDSATTGVDGDQNDDSMPYAGAVYVFGRDGAAWQQRAYLKPAQNDGGDNFGSAVALSADGNLLAVGAVGDDSAATGIDGDANDNSMPFAGAAYLFERDGSSWQQQAYLKASNTDEGDEFGYHLSLSGSGNTLVVGAALEASTARGFDGDQYDNSAPEAGAVYVFSRDAGPWGQRAFIKAPSSDAGDRFGWSMALSTDGDLLLVGASREASAATGLDGDQNDNSTPRAGAAFLY